eukprot:30810-Pelagococcus_subviridis.AAC.4
MRHQPRLRRELSLRLDPPHELRVDAHELDRVGDEVALDREVQRRVHPERRRVVHLDQPRSQGRSIRANVGVELKGVSWS